MRIMLTAVFNVLRVQVTLVPYRFFHGEIPVAVEDQRRKTRTNTGLTHERQ
jgi:hypothetical protein